MASKGLSSPCSQTSSALANGTGREVVKQGGDSWFFITADYVFGKSLEGALGGLAGCLAWAALASGTGQLPWGVAMAGALVASLVEILPIPLDDNLAITLFASLAAGLISNLCLLGFFKYFNFGLDNWNAAMTAASSGGRCSTSAATRSRRATGNARRRR